MRDAEHGAGERAPWMIRQSRRHFRVGLNTGQMEGRSWTSVGWCKIVMDRQGHGVFAVAGMSHVWFYRRVRIISTSLAMTS